MLLFCFFVICKELLSFFHIEEHIATRFPKKIEGEHTHGDRHRRIDRPRGVRHRGRVCVEEDEDRRHQSHTDDESIEGENNEGAEKGDFLLVKADAHENTGQQFARADVGVRRVAVEQGTDDVREEIPDAAVRKSVEFSHDGEREKSEVESHRRIRGGKAEESAENDACRDHDRGENEREKGNAMCALLHKKYLRRQIHLCSRRGEPVERKLFAPRAGSVRGKDYREKQKTKAKS